MAKVKLNPVLESIRGKVGDLVFRRYNDEMVVSKMPDRSGVVPTPGQVAQQDQFRLAVLYGKAVLADEDLRIIYDDVAARKGEPMFALTVGDFLNAPAIHEIDMSSFSGAIGDVINIRATDDIEVQGVSVAIRDQEGEVLEEGPAVWTPASATWQYTATTALAQGQSVSIDVSATDRPGHKTNKSEAFN